MVGTYWLRADDRVFQIIEWFEPTDGTPIYGHAKNLATSYGRYYVCFSFSFLTIGGHQCEPISEDELPFYLLSVE